MYVTKLFKKMERKFFVNVVLTKDTFFLGTVSNNERTNIATTIVLDIYRYLIWQAKLEEKKHRLIVSFLAICYT
jgi:hypothetical protein